MDREVTRVACVYCVDEIASMVERNGVHVCEVCGDPIDFGGAPNAAVEGGDAPAPPPPVPAPIGVPRLGPEAQALVNIFRAHAAHARSLHA